MISGALLLADAAVTLLWQEPLTAVVALIKRDGVDKRFLSYDRAPLSQLEQNALASLRDQRQRIAYLARQERAADKDRRRDRDSSDAEAQRHLHGRPGDR